MRAVEWADVMNGRDGVFQEDAFVRKYDFLAVLQYVLWTTVRLRGWKGGKGIKERKTERINCVNKIKKAWHAIRERSAVMQQS